MTYSAENIEKLSNDYEKVVNDLQDLTLEGLRQSGEIGSEEAKRYLRHGVGRRLGILKKSVEKIFELFPPSQVRPLEREVLTEVQIYLHAFVINLSGLFDNWAWAFLFRHDLANSIDKRNVSFFKKEMRELLPSSLREYLESTQISNWRNEYLKSYRDALAHRIPLYIPPALWTKEDSRRYEELEAEKIACISRRDWNRLDVVWAEQDVIGVSCPYFLHESSDAESARPLYLHPQVLCDGMTVAEFGGNFYKFWLESAYLQK